MTQPDDTSIMTIKKKPYLYVIVVLYRIFKQYFYYATFKDQKITRDCYIALKTNKKNKNNLTNIK